MVGVCSQEGSRGGQQGGPVRAGGADMGGPGDLHRAQEAHLALHRLLLAGARRRRAADVSHRLGHEVDDGGQVGLVGPGRDATGQGGHHVGVDAGIQLQPERLKHSSPVRP